MKRTYLVSAGAGLIFGIGLVLAGMTQPAKVVGFLDFAGAWDPSLALVMAGAIGVYLPIVWLIRRRGMVTSCGHVCVQVSHMLESVSLKITES